MKTSMLLRRGFSHVRVQEALWSYCAEKSVEMHSSLFSKVAYVRWRWCVAHLCGRKCVVTGLVMCNEGRIQGEGYLSIQSCGDQVS